MLINSRYQIQNEYSRGVRSLVYLVQDRYRSGEEYILKKFDFPMFDEQDIRNFEKEMTQLTQWKHPNLVQIHSFGFDDEDNAPFIIMKNAGPDTLARKPHAFIHLDQSLKRELIIAMCRSLLFIHSFGRIHGKIKPSSVYISRNKVLLNIGIVQSIPFERKTLTVFPSPEEIKGKRFDQRTDFYHLGFTIACLLTGKIWFSVSDKARDATMLKFSTFKMLKQQILESLHDKQLVQVLDSLLQWLPDDRPQNIYDVFRLLSDAFGNDIPLESRETKDAYTHEVHFIGRKAELKSLRQGLSKKCLIALRGEPGTGKSRLVKEFNQFCRLRSIPFFSGNCYEAMNRPYQPFLEILHELLFTAPKNMIDQYGPNLKGLLPQHPVLTTYSVAKYRNPAREKIKLFDSICSLILDAPQGAMKPAVFAIHDLHWIDNISLDLLKQLSLRLAACTDTCKRMILITSDNSIGTVSNDFWQVAGNTKVLKQILLEPFSREDCVSFVESAFGSSNCENSFLTYIRKIADEINGNPLLMREILRLLVKENRIDRVESLWRLNSPLPDEVIPSIVENLGALRLERLQLGHDEQKALFYYALLNKPMTIDEFQFFLADKVNVIIRNLFAQLESDGILIADQFADSVVYHFSHSLIQQGVIEKIPEKPAMHRYIAERLERMYGHRLGDIIEILAYHYGETDSTMIAAEYFEKVGDKAKLAYDNSKALQSYQSAIEKLQEQEPGAVIRLLLKKCEIFDLIGQWDDYEETGKFCMVQAKKLNNKYLVARAQHSLAHLYRVRGEYDAAYKYLNEAYAIFTEYDDQEQIARVVSDLGNVFWSLGKSDEALKCYRHRLDIAKKTADKKGFSQAIHNIGNIYLRLNEYDKAMSCYVKKLEIDKEMKNRRGESNALANIGLIHKMKGHFHEALACHQENLKIAKELGDKRGRANAIGNLGNVYFALKNYQRAATCFHTWLELAEELGDKRNIGNALGSMGTLKLTVGEYGEAGTILQEALNIAVSINDKVNICISKGQLGQVYAATKNYDAAFRLLDDAEALCRSVPLQYYLVEVLLQKSIILYDTGHLDKAEEKIEEALVISREINHCESLPGVEIMSLKISYSLAETPEQAKEILGTLVQRVDRTEDFSHQLEILAVLFELTGDVNYAKQAQEVVQTASSEDDSQLIVPEILRHALTNEGPSSKEPDKSSGGKES